MPKPIDTPEYWIDTFSASSRDLDRIYEHVLEAGEPFDVEELSAILIRHHAGRVAEAHRASAAADGVAYEPSEHYKVGQKIVFPLLDGAVGVVAEVRPGNNPEYGSYEVVKVELDGEVRRFAAGLQWEHALSQSMAEVDPEELAERYGGLVAPQLATALAKDPEWVSLADRWILKALLPEIHAGHRNLAEAILMLAGQPMPAEEILPELELDASISLPTRVMAVDLALSTDDRFQNLGALESPLWSLQSRP